MRDLRAAAFLMLALLISLSSCRQDRPANRDDTPPPVELPADDPGAVLYYLSEILHQNRDSLALLPWCLPDTRLKLQTGAWNMADLPFMRYEDLEGLDCRITGDTALCLFAGLVNDRLVLDSTRLIRRDGRWLLDATAFLPQTLGQ